MPTIVAQRRNPTSGSISRKGWRFRGSEGQTFHWEFEVHWIKNVSSPISPVLFGSKKLTQTVTVVHMDGLADP